MTNRIRLALVLLGIGLGFPAAALAASAKQEPNADALMKAKVTAAEAVASVEKQAPGQVIELDLGMRGGALAYTVTVLGSNGTESEFLVDAGSGAVSPYTEKDDEEGEAENNG